MGFYDRYILPTLLNAACSTKPIMKQREKIVPHAEGRVLEIGMGSGTNLPLYDPNKVDVVLGLEPSEGMIAKARKAIDAAPVRVEPLILPGEDIPLEDDSVDTVVLTFTLCTIPGFDQALQQMRRVLKPSGRLLFCEHGEAPDPGVAKWQSRINPVWKVIAGGCNLNRPIPKLLEANGFAIHDMQTMYLPSTPKIAGFNYWGDATKR